MPSDSSSSSQQQQQQHLNQQQEQQHLNQQQEQHLNQQQQQHLDQQQQQHLNQQQQHPSKTVLTIALAKAQSAVLLDTALQIPEAIEAYSHAVLLLEQVIDKIDQLGLERDQRDLNGLLRDQQVDRLWAQDLWASIPSHPTLDPTQLDAQRHQVLQLLRQREVRWHQKRIRIEKRKQARSDEEDRLVGIHNTYASRIKELEAELAQTNQDLLALGSPDAYLGASSSSPSSSSLPTLNHHHHHNHNILLSSKSGSTSSSHFDPLPPSDDVSSSGSPRRSFSSDKTARDQARSLNKHSTSVRHLVLRSQHHPFSSSDLDHDESHDLVSDSLPSPSFPPPTSSSSHHSHSSSYSSSINHNHNHTNHNHILINNLNTCRLRSSSSVSGASLSHLGRIRSNDSLATSTRTSISSAPFKSDPSLPHPPLPPHTSLSHHDPPPPPPPPLLPLPLPPLPRPARAESFSVLDSNLIPSRNKPSSPPSSTLLAPSLPPLFDHASELQISLPPTRPNPHPPHLSRLLPSRATLPARSVYTPCSSSSSSSSSSASILLLDPHHPHHPQLPLTYLDPSFSLDASPSSARTTPPLAPSPPVPPSKSLALRRPSNASLMLPGSISNSNPHHYRPHHHVLPMRMRAYSQPGKRLGPPPTPSSPHPTLPRDLQQRLASTASKLLPLIPSTTTTTSPSHAFHAPSTYAHAQSILSGPPPYIATPPLGDILPYPPTPLRRPFHLMKLIRASILTGAYLSPKLYVPKQTWSQTGIRLSNLENKIKLCEALEAGLDAVFAGVPGHDLLLLSYPSTTTPSCTLSKPSTPTEPNSPAPPNLKGLLAVAERFNKKLEAFEDVLRGLENGLGKKLGLGFGTPTLTTHGNRKSGASSVITTFTSAAAAATTAGATLGLHPDGQHEHSKGRKPSAGPGGPSTGSSITSSSGSGFSASAFANKLGKGLDRFNIGRNGGGDLVGLYVETISKLFRNSQIFDDHLAGLTNTATTTTTTTAINDDGKNKTNININGTTATTTTAYESLGKEIKTSIEQRLKRTSDFYSLIVCRFVINDMGLLLDVSFLQ